MENPIIKTLKRLYAKPWHVMAFVIWRCWHTPYAAMEKFIPKTGLIIDLGCGVGLFSNFLALTSGKRRIIGIDVSQEKLKFADKGFNNVLFRKLDAINLDYANCKAIALIHLLHHLSCFKQQERLLKVCYDCLDKGGVLLVLEIDKNPLWKFLFTKFVDRVAYPKDKFYFRKSPDFVAILRKAGFKDVKAVPIHQGVPLSHVLFTAHKQ